MKYKTLNELYRAYEFDELDRVNSPIKLRQNSVMVENDSGEVVFEMYKDEIIEEMAYWIHMPFQS
jgi:hypothetical protein